MSIAAEKSRTAEHRAWRAWDARLATEVRRMAAELKVSAEKPQPMKGLKRQCPV
jgi:hypothetical protein